MGNNTITYQENKKGKEGFHKGQGDKMGNITIGPPT